MSWQEWDTTEDIPDAGVEVDIQHYRGDECDGFYEYDTLQDIRIMDEAKAKEFFLEWDREFTSQDELEGLIHEFFEKEIFNINYRG
jgi:hypothetical protein